MLKLLLGLFLAVILFTPQSAVFAQEACRFECFGSSVKEGVDKCKRPDGSTYPNEAICDGGKTPSTGSAYDPNCVCNPPGTPAAPAAATTLPQCPSDYPTVAPIGGLGGAVRDINDCPSAAKCYKPVPGERDLYACFDGPPVTTTTTTTNPATGATSTTTTTTGIRPAATAGTTTPSFCSDPANKDKCTGGKGLTCNIVTGNVGVVKGEEGGIMTAMGCIPTHPRRLIEGVLWYGTLAAGGIAFLLMILASIQMITAEGNPESIKHAQERFYSAIIGLLLIIFSALLLQVIGFDILGLPGFNR